MGVQIPRSRKELKNHLKDPLYRNSYFLLLTSIIPTALGFLFWVFATHLYSPSDVGVVTATISIVNLLAGFSRLGFDFGVIRYLPDEAEKEKLINSCITTISVIALLLSFMFIIFFRFFFLSSSFLTNNFKFEIFFIIFTIFFSLILFLQRVFLSFRRAEFSFIQALMNSSLKILLLFLFIPLKAFGLFLSWGLPTVIIPIISLFVFVPYLCREYYPKIRIDKRIINNMFYFSFGNYIAENLWYLPGRIFPLIIIVTLSAEMAAYFYIAWSLASIFYIIPSVVGMALFAEGSYSCKNLRSVTINAIKFTFLFLAPIMIIVFVFGNSILLLFGKSYSKNAFDLMLLLVLTAIPYTFVHFYISIERIIKRTRNIVISYAAIATISISMGYILLINNVGIVGVGVSWFLSHLVVVFFVLFSKNLFRSFGGEKR